MRMPDPILRHRLSGRAAIAAIAALIALAGCSGGSPSAPPRPAPMADAAVPAPAPSGEALARERARVRLQLAAGYYEHGQVAVALDEINRALAADPSYAQAYTLRGLAYMRQGDPDLAEDSFRRSLALDPRNPDTMHNYGWLLCQQGRYGDASARFSQALAVPGYTQRAKTLMTQGLCQMKAGLNADAERSLMQSYELDAANPVTGYNLALLFAQRQDWPRARFYIRHINEGPSATAETLWQGIKVERRLGNREEEAQLAAQLQRRFPQSREAMLYERGNFND